MEVEVLYPWLRKYGNLFQIQSKRWKHYQFSKINLKPGQLISVNVNLAKIIYGKYLKLFQLLLSQWYHPFWFLATKKKIVYKINMYCMFFFFVHLVKYALSDSVFLLFCCIFLCYLASISHFLYVNMNQDLCHIRIKL